MGLIECFIKKGLTSLGIESLEKYANQWSETPDTLIKEEVYPHIIKTKLKIYESEY